MLVGHAGHCRTGPDFRWPESPQQRTANHILVAAALAADAAALAGVPSLPGQQATAFSTAKSFTKSNGFNDADSDVVVTTGIDGTPTRLRVTVTKTVDNVFGGLFGINKTTITRSAVADFAGPVPMGSPCNEFGNDPEPGTFKSDNCSDTGQFWANVGSAGREQGQRRRVPEQCLRNRRRRVHRHDEHRLRPQRLLLHADPDAAGQQPGHPGLRPGADRRGRQLHHQQLVDSEDPPSCSHGRHEPGHPLCRRIRAARSAPATSASAAPVRFDTQFTIRTPGGSPWDPTTFPISTSAGCTTTSWDGYTRQPRPGAGQEPRQLQRHRGSELPAVEAALHVVLLPRPAPT